MADSLLLLLILSSVLNSEPEEDATCPSLLRGRGFCHLSCIFLSFMWKNFGYILSKSFLSKPQSGTKLSFWREVMDGRVGGDVHLGLTEFPGP